MSKNVQPEAVINEATKNLTKVHNSLMKGVELLEVLVEDSDELTNEINRKKIELGTIETQMSEDLRKAKAELQINILENEAGVLENLLEKNSLAKISVKDFNELVKAFEDSKEESEIKLKEIESKVTEKLEAKHELKVKELVASNSVENATLKAEVVSLKHKVESLTEANIGLRDMINEERKARVEVAKASKPTMVAAASAA